LTIPRRGKRNRLLVYTDLALLCKAATAIYGSYDDGAFGLAIKNYLGNFLEYWVFELKFRIERRLKS
jgi:hypothetical protein